MGLTTVNAGRPCWIDIAVRSPEEREGLVSFLCSVFDWTYEVTGPGTGFYTMLRRDGVDVAAVGQQSEAGGAWVTYLSTEDIHETARRVEDNGGRVIAEPMAVMRAGSRAVATDPVGATFGLWQPDLFAGFPDVIAAGYPEWFHHGSADVDAATSFYVRALALEVVPHAGDTMLGRDGRGYFSLGRNVAGIAADLRPVILVDDLADVESRIEGAGGQIYASRVEVPGGFATSFADPIVGAPLIASVNAAGAS